MRDSFILYTSFYEPLKYLSDIQMGKLFRAIFEYQITGNTETDNDIRIAFEFIKNQLDIDANKWKDEKNKRSEAGRMGGIKRALNQNQALSSKSKQCLNASSKSKQSQANQAVNVNVNENENENVNENVTAIAVIGSDSCVDGSLQSDSCVDEVANSNSEMLQFDSCVDGIVKFYNANIGLITPYEFEILNSYRADFSDDVIIYALQLQAEKRVAGVAYAKAILNNWKKKNIKTLLEAKRENETRKTNVKKESTSNSYRTDSLEQYGDLSKFYLN